MAMNAPERTLHEQHRRPAEQLHESFFALFGGPVAWFMQLCLGYALASESCFPGAERRLALPAHLIWTRGAMALAMIAACVIALLACASSARSYRRSSLEMQRDVHHVVRVGAEGTCFLALWGVLFSAGFALASVLTFLAYFMLPRCAG